MTRRLLKEGIIPMFYADADADADNPASNTLYMKVGYVKQGEITEFQFDDSI